MMIKMMVMMMIVSALRANAQKNRANRGHSLGLDKLRASEPASHSSRASESCESCESSCEPCETEVRRKENPFFGES